MGTFLLHQFAGFIYLFILYRYGVIAGAIECATLKAMK